MQLAKKGSTIQSGIPETEILAESDKFFKANWSIDVQRHLAQLTLTVG